jgi:hypothetical protein
VTVSISDFVPLQPVTYDPQSEVNALGLVIVLDGLPYSVVSADWTENGHGATDTMTVVVPLSTNPDFPLQLFRGTTSTSPAEIAAATADVVAELYVALSAERASRRN